ncbi:acyltransferase family protein [Turicibacter sanguinis]|uniref:acyltransferase family protein n=1 Tax=Turicibacter sanguinis TaxID=154288 RepID=UPI00147D56B2|nr:acyltransferase family protein [Turicibacter sanguinis]MCU7212920.1 acyltransferase family protein [Turicibacter sanguinis]QJS18981.1 acyltransferase family protein [Turicibacter sanguinis]
MKTGKRNSNFELLRIIAMVMIVSLHTLGHGGGLNNTTVNSINFIFNHILESLSIVAVNIFILISGYFGIKSYSSVKSKISLLYKQMIFYSIIIGFIFIVFDKNLSSINIIQMLFPISTQLWWFMSLNIVLLILLVLV